MIQFTPIRGFVNTPVSKSVCIISAFLAVFTSIAQIKYVSNLQLYPFIIEYSQYWRLATFQLTTINESDFLLVFLLWFMFKNLERFYGSRKYLSIITTFSVYNSLVVFLVLCFAQIFVQILKYFMYVKLGLGSSNDSDVLYLIIFNSVTAGPLGIVSSLYTCYGNFIPVSYKFNIILSTPPTETDSDVGSTDDTLTPYSITLTNHLQIHVLYTLLFLNHGFQSIIPCLVGLFLGKLYLNDLLPGAKWILPNSIFKLFVSPIKTITHVNNSVIRSVNIGHPTTDTEIDNMDNLASPLLDEDRDATEQNLDGTIDGSRTIRAETPVRPLGRQFFDTFRSNPN